MGSRMCDRSSLSSDRRVRMQFDRSNLVDVGLARKVVLVTSKRNSESFSTSVQSFHSERTSRRSKEVTYFETSLRR